MCTNKNHTVGIHYTECEYLPQSQNRWRQQLFNWQRLLVARPPKPARSDADG
jgi:hypothetical protein